MSLLTTLAPHRAHRADLGLFGSRRIMLQPASSAGPEDTAEYRIVDERVFAVQRAGAALVGLFLLVFGLLGLTSGVPLLSSHGQRFLGLSANGLLSAISVAVAVVLLGAALRGPRIASTVMMVLGGLFLVSALVNLVALDTAANLLAFEMADVVFSVVVGLLLLVLGAYGRVSGHLPDDSPYARPHADAPQPTDAPSTPEEVAAEAAMRVAEIAVVEHRASEEQRRRVLAMATARTRAERRRVWLQLEGGLPPSPPMDPRATPATTPGRRSALPQW